MGDNREQQHLTEIINHGFTCQAILLGQRLGLFKYLSEAPITCAQLASSANCKERYVLEWLKIMTVAKLVNYNAEDETWHISGTLIDLFERESPAMLELSWLDMIKDITERIGSCFEKDGPTGAHNSEYADFHERMAKVSDKNCKHWLFNVIIPEVPGLLARLENGCNYLDIGCGSGMPAYLIAQKYSKARCIGIDIDAEAIEKAVSKEASQGVLENVEYLQMDGSNLRPEWTEYFDFVTAFDAIHDQAYPNKSLAEICRVLKKGGMFTMVDIDAHSDVTENMTNPNAEVLYTMSLFHCMPVSLAEPEGLGLGTMWGREKAKEMLEEAGFKNVAFRKLNDFVGHYHCTCQKL